MSEGTKNESGCKEDGELKRMKQEKKYNECVEAASEGEERQDGEGTGWGAGDKEGWRGIGMGRDEEG